MTRHSLDELVVQAGSDKKSSKAYINIDPNGIRVEKVKKFSDFILNKKHHFFETELF